MIILPLLKTIARNVATCAPIAAPIIFLATTAYVIGTILDTAAKLY